VTLLLTDEATAEPADRCLQLLTARVRSGEISGGSQSEIQKLLSKSLSNASQRNLDLPSTISAIELSASLKEKNALEQAKRIFSQSDSEPIRVRLLNAVINAGDASALDMGETLLTSRVSSDTQRKAVQALGRPGTKAGTDRILKHLPMLPPDVQPAAIETLTDREESAVELLTLVRDGRIPATVINANQANKMLNLRS
jgi:hypothetical protein